jgi:hypothetical protein
MLVGRRASGFVQVGMAAVIGPNCRELRNYAQTLDVAEQ